MKIKRVNIGKIIEEVVKEKRISVAAFAKSINMQRQNIKKTIFEKNSLDTDLLIQISEVLDHYFFQYYGTDEERNKNYYNEVRGILSIEFGKEKKDQVFKFIFGENNVEILNK